MGTNFYTGNPKLKSGKHIGKRSAAGWYCWTCGITLCKTGKSHIHDSEADKWYKECPICGNSIPVEKITEGAVGRELGFNKSKPKIVKTGITSCASFTWAMNPKDMIDPADCGDIYDEYGNKYTIGKFIEMILFTCPIQYFHMIGEEFS